MQHHQQLQHPNMRYGMRRQGGEKSTSQLRSKQNSASRSQSKMRQNANSVEPNQEYLINAESDRLPAL